MQHDALEQTNRELVRTALAAIKADFLAELTRTITEVYNALLLAGLPPALVREEIAAYQSAEFDFKLEVYIDRVPVNFEQQDGSTPQGQFH